MSQDMHVEDNKTLKSIALSVFGLLAMTVILIVAANIFF
jgi:hypothetical protein